MSGEMPALLEEIRTVAGLSAALHLAAARGGRRVYVPAKLPERHWLVDAVGREAAAAIAAHFAHDGVGAYLDIPMPMGGSYTQQARARARAMMAALEDGQSLNGAAALAGVTRRSVLRFKARLKEQQGDLFGGEE